MYMVNASQGKLAMLPVTEAIVALQFVKFTVPKLVNSEMVSPRGLSIVGLSIIHSALNWLEW